MKRRVHTFPLLLVHALFQHSNIMQVWVQAIEGELSRPCVTQQVWCNERRLPEALQEVTVIFTDVFD